MSPHFENALNGLTGLAGLGGKLNGSPQTINICVPWSADFATAYQQFINTLFGNNSVVSQPVFGNINLPQQSIFNSNNVIPQAPLASYGTSGLTYGTAEPTYSNTYGYGNFTDFPTNGGGYTPAYMDTPVQSPQIISTQGQSGGSIVNWIKAFGKTFKVVAKIVGGILSIVGIFSQ